MVRIVLSTFCLLWSTVPVAQAAGHPRPQEGDFTIRDLIEEGRRY